jgi:broad specificity phosphatase PhoE
VLVLVRHGQTDANARGLLQGRLDLPLSELGRRQAAALAMIVPEDARIIASPLRRALETAAAFGAERKIEVDDRWIELDYGEFDAQPIGDLPPDVWATWRSDPHFAPPGGESLVTLGTRVRSACEELLDEARRRDVVVVSHVSPIKAAIAWALGVGDEVAWRLFVQVASVTRIGVGPGGPSLHTFNETSAIEA